MCQQAMRSPPEALSWAARGTWGWQHSRDLAPLNNGLSGGVGGGDQACWAVADRCHNLSGCPRLVQCVLEGRAVRLVAYAVASRQEHCVILVQTIIQNRLQAFGIVYQLLRLICEARTAARCTWVPGRGPPNGAAQARRGV